MQSIVLKQMCDFINHVFILQNKTKINQKGKIRLSIVIDLSSYPLNIFENIECLLSKEIPVLYLHDFSFHNLMTDNPSNH